MKQLEQVHLCRIFSNRTHELYEFLRLGYRYGELNHISGDRGPLINLFFHISKSNVNLYIRAVCYKLTCVDPFRS